MGLIFDKNGSLNRSTPEPKIITKLKGRTLYDVEIMWIYPFRYRLPFLKTKGKPPCGKLLRKISTKETFHVPFYDEELTEQKIITKDSSIYLCPLLDNYKRWSKRKGYTYHNRAFTENELLAEE